MGRRGRVGGPPPQGPVPVLAGLMDGNGCSIGTHILSYKPKWEIKYIRAETINLIFETMTELLLPVYYSLLENHWTIPYVDFGSVDPGYVLNRNLCLGEYLN